MDISKMGLEQIKSILDVHAGGIEIMQKKYIDYPDFDATYHFIVLKKLI